MKTNEGFVYGQLLKNCENRALTMEEALGIIGQDSQEEKNNTAQEFAAGGVYGYKLSKEARRADVLMEGLGMSR